LDSILSPRVGDDDFFNSLLVKEVGQLIEDIRAQLGDEKPVVIVIDTLNRSIAGSESSDEDMSDYIKAADAIRETFTCAVAVIHHCGKDGSRPRGHTSLTGAADGQIAISKDSAGIVSSRVEYLKDGAEGAETHSRLDVVELGTDDDGEPITSCVVQEAENASTGMAAQPHLSKNQQTMLALLNSKGGGLTVEGWNDLARAEGIGTKRKADLYDLRTALKSRNLVYEHDGRWFPTR
jgi:hypothetical protein